MAHILLFKKIGKKDVHLAGGKGASLGEMTRAGINVPSGFVILSSAFNLFMEEANIKVEIDSILHHTNHNEMQSVEKASETIRAIILGQKLPVTLEKEIFSNFHNLHATFVAVRSSATAEDGSIASWAGQLETFLNTTEKTLSHNIMKCWASLFTPRAIFYRFEKGLHGTPISVAVVIQKMVNSEVSGIAFSVHPITEDSNQLIIEAGFGQGEAIVSGNITPDSYILEKKPFRIFDKHISIQTKELRQLSKGGCTWFGVDSSKGSMQKLSDAQIKKLGELVLRIESHYAFPVDVEWALEKNKFYILQSRPITTLRSTHF